MYKQHIPLANACAAGTEWQSYDIVWTAPRFSADGSLSMPPYLTVLHNGVLIQNHVSLAGETVYEGAPSYRAHGPSPVKLQDHGDGVKFRNIWIRPLPYAEMPPKTMWTYSAREPRWISMRSGARLRPC